MKKIIIWTLFLCFICFIVEAARTPGILKSASSTKVNQKEKDSSNKIKLDPNGTAEITETSESSETSLGSSETQDSSYATLPDGKAYVGVISFLYLREEPFGEELARLYNNDEVIIVDRDGDWYEVETEKGSGWVYGKCIFDSPNTNTKDSSSKMLANIDDEDEDEEYDDIDDEYENDEDDEEDVDSNKSKGTYYFYTFNDPGDYKITFDSTSNISTSSQKTKPIKQVKNTKGKTENQKDKSSKSASKDTKKDTKTLSISSDSGDHMKAAAYWVDKVYEEVRRNKCRHKGPCAKRFEDIKKKKRISCTSSASIVFQQAGIIPKGKIVNHTNGKKRGYARDGFDKALKDSVKNVDNLIAGTCDIVMVMKKYKDCPKWLKRKGIFYIQKSNGCVAGDNGWIYSCNHTGHRYTRRVGKHNGYYQKGGYPKKRPILFAFVPRTNGKSNVPDNCGFKVKPASGSGKGKIAKW